MSTPNPPESTGPIDREAWMTFALPRIRSIVDNPRERMTDDELSVDTFASNAIAGGEPTIPLVARGAGRRLCRMRLAEWSSEMTTLGFSHDLADDFLQALRTEVAYLDGPHAVCYTSRRFRALSGRRTARIS